MRETTDEHTPRLLIVDDEAWIRAYLRELLIEWGYAAWTAPTVTAGCAALEQRDFDVVITDLFIGVDIAFPVLNAAQRIRSAPEVVVITGRGSAESAVQALNFGAFDYLAKPLDAERLRLTLRRALDFRRLKSEVARLGGGTMQPYAANVAASALAFHDSVTGLPNRILFFDRLQQMLLGHSEPGRAITLIIVSVEGLRRASLAYGFRYYDEVLAEVARRLREVVYLRDTVSRTAGSEFSIVCKLKEPDNVTRLLAKISGAIDSVGEAGYRLEGIGLNMGVALYPHDGATAEELYQRASIALDTQRESHQHGYQFYEPERGRHVQRVVGLERQLTRGLQDRRFSIMLQPYHRVADGSVHGAEALLRWDADDGTRVSPAEFIPLLEHTRSIVTVTEWIVGLLGTLQGQFFDQGITNQWLSFNLSPVHLQRFDDTKRLVTLIANRFRRPSQLVIEVTEGMFLQDSRAVDKAIALFKEVGIPLAIDDFGTGYSALSYLTRYRFDYIKIDRSFVGTADQRSDAATIVAAIISMAQQLGIATVGEGVENEAQMDVLRRFGCDIVQGYHFSRPVSPQDLFDYVRRSPQRTETVDTLALESASRDEHPDRTG